MTNQHHSEDVFAIGGGMRLYLVLQVIFPLFVIGITIWAISQPGLGLTEAGPFILGAFALWALWEVTRLVKWSRFTVGISDAGIRVRDRSWAWDEIASGRARTAFKFGTFIELRAKDGTVIAIPAAVRNNSFVLTLVEKHLPALVREG